MIDPSPTAALMLFTRYPVPGRAKTRLIPHLGAEGAADLQRRMTEYILGQMSAAAQQLPLAIEIHFAGGDLSTMQSWLGPEGTYCPQCSGDLGDRLSAAFTAALGRGKWAAIAIGSDCPALGTDHLSAALTALKSADVVLGPATDGGYYLIGLTQPQPALFANIAWGTDQVLRQTVSAAAAQGLTVELLTPLNDIDRPEDLPEWEHLIAP